ncbi:MAG: biotin--[acetyl-CoA-carboxylase] ligase [Spirochaetes bacterium]|nr:biotin--[acetyl-CoA-carboxylase] ligase [Spirochaetota bacterium]
MKIDLLKKTDFSIIHFDEINSTNLYALEHMTSIPDKTVITADIQKNGRGRLDRKWVSSSSDNIYFSVVLKPEGKIETLPLANVTQYMCIILCRIFLKYGINPSIKWPNDILINGKKISGILSETSFTGGVFNGIVIGAGININCTPAQNEELNKPVTSLYSEIKSKIDKTNFLIDLLGLFFDTYTDFMTYGFKHIKTEYLNYFPFTNRTITVNNQGSIIEGKVKDISDDGTLVLLKSNGTEINIIAGDIA